MRGLGRLLAAGVAVLLLGAAQPVMAAPQDPIDAALSACLDSADGQTTVGMIGCLDTAYTAWDKALNDVYANLLDLYDAESLAALKASQRKWITFRDAERKFLRVMQKPHNGTLVRVVAAQGLVDIVRARTLELRAYAQ